MNVPKFMGIFSNLIGLKVMKLLIQPLEVSEQWNFSALFATEVSIDNERLSRNELKITNLCSIKIMDTYECRHHSH